jgi:hypothetical protein
MAIRLTLTGLVVLIVLSIQLSYYSGKASVGNNKTVSSLKTFLRNRLSDIPSEVSRGARYRAAFVDLNDDGDNEVIVYLYGGRLCGTGGCNTYILDGERPNYRIVTMLSIGFPPIHVLPAKSHGWHDISIVVAGGGVRGPYVAELSFNGTSYPENASVPPARPARARGAGQVVIPRPPRGPLLGRE